MKAVVIRRHGGPEVLEYIDVPEPTPGYGEVLLRIRAVGMNFNDVWARNGLPDLKFSFPHMPGSDAAGEVVALGAGVTSVSVGDRVMVNPVFSCRNCPACLSGQEYLCKHLQIWGFQTGPMHGGYAEYARIPASNLIPMPAGLTFEQAAAVPAGLATSWHMLITRAKLKPGEDVLIWGATSSIGVYAIQICKLINARAIAIAGSDHKLAVAKELGASELINYRTQDVFREVRRITKKRGVDVVFEHTGAETWKSSIMCMAYGARLVTCGNTTGFDVNLDLRVLFWKHLSLLGCHVFSQAELLESLKFVSSGQIRPVVDRILPLSEAPLAHQWFEEGNKAGKIVLIP